PGPTGGFVDRTPGFARGLPGDRTQGRGRIRNLTMNSLPLIPTPPAQRWKDFRLHGLPVIAFALVASTIVVLWNNSLVPGMFTGEVEAVQENVASVKPGQLVNLSVDQFQSVKAGDTIALVITTDPRVIEASLAVIRAEVELLKTGMDPILNQ